MSEGSVEFFKELGQRGHEPLLAKVSGTARFELVDGDRVDRWLVAIDNGDVSVAHKGGKADCLIRGRRRSSTRCAAARRTRSRRCCGAPCAAGVMSSCCSRSSGSSPGPRRERLTADAKAMS